VRTLRRYHAVGLLGIGIYAVRSGRITEGWFAEDIFGMLQQLQLVTPPG
jgi:hypothetical protein